MDTWGFCPWGWSGWGMKPQSSSGLKNEWHFTGTVSICLHHHHHHLLSFRRSIKDCKIQMAMEIITF